MPVHGQLRQLGAWSDCPGHHNLRVGTGGISVKELTKDVKKTKRYKYNKKEIALAAKKMRKN